MSIWQATPTDKDTVYSRLSKQDKDKLHTILFNAIHSNYLDLLKELLQTGVNMNDIKNEVGCAARLVIK